ncbi:MAG: amidohydrolase family protein [Rhodospirillaceae bacterium]
MTGTPEAPRPVTPAEIVRGTDTRDMLARAKKQAVARRYDDYLIIDVDAHQFETQSWPDIVEYIENPVIRDLAKSFQNNGRMYPGILQSTGWPNYQHLSGRIPHERGLEERTTGEGEVHPDVVLARRAMDSMGIDRQVIFPTPMLVLGLHPEPHIEVALAEAYNAWMLERVVPGDDRLLFLPYVPFNDPEAAEATVRKYIGHPSVVGFVVTSCRYRPVHHNAYMRLYAMLEEAGKPLAFHAGPNWEKDGYIGQLNRFLTVHAISFALCNIVHLSNWVVNGLPERFPKLKVVWIESGLSWLPFVMQRLDSEYLMRSSEAPLLRRLPSEYIREMYYTNQPMEFTSPRMLEATFAEINAETQLLYSSDWPHWDFDLPSVIFDLPFLTDDARRNILGLNAKAVFGL